MRQLGVATLVAMAVGLAASTSQAGFIIDVYQVGPNVHMSYSGSMTFVGSGASAFHNTGNWVQGNEFYAVPAGDEIQFTGGRTPNLTLFPNGGGRVNANSLTGTTLGFLDDGRVVTAPFGGAGWSGQTYSASGTMVFNNRTVSNFINLGTVRTVNWTQTGQSFNTNNTITVRTVPEASLACLSGLVTAASVLSLRRRES